jgi:hypothetical protein
MGVRARAALHLIFVISILGFVAPAHVKLGYLEPGPC